jgi:predicted enzyme related to lactoylglutathione lyase
MAHRSRLTAVLVDVPAAARDQAAAFWTAALGAKPQEVPNNPEYDYFGEVTPGIEFMVQGTGDDRPHVHFDIESDDVDAEVARLEALGATVVERVKSWVVMRDPVGTTFCVVKIQLKDSFEAHATTWE